MFLASKNLELFSPLRTIFLICSKFHNKLIYYSNLDFGVGGYRGLTFRRMSAVW